MKARVFIILSFIGIVVLSCNSSDNPYENADPVDVEHNDVDYDYTPGNGGDTGTPGGGDSGNSGDSADSGDSGDSVDSGDSSDSGNTVQPDDDSYAGEPADVPRCIAGSASYADKQAALKELNRVRGMNGLSAVSYNEKDDAKTQECSLIIAANEKLSHDPPSSWKCFSDDGHDGCAGSNIYVRWGMIDEVSAIDVLYALLKDEKVDSLGHRRHFLDPWLHSTSYGRVNDYDKDVAGAAMMVNDKSSGTMPGYSGSGKVIIPYPYHAYPAALVDKDTYFSFTLIADPRSKANNRDVIFSSAVITVETSDGGKKLTVKNQKFNNEFYGVPNVLMWQVPDVQTGIEYTVHIRNVIYQETPQDYTYTFILQ